LAKNGIQQFFLKQKQNSDDNIHKIYKKYKEQKYTCMHTQEYHVLRDLLPIESIFQFPVAGSVPDLAARVPDITAPAPILYLSTESVSTADFLLVYTPSIFVVLFVLTAVFSAPHFV
jgi:hypothetical protein